MLTAINQQFIIEKLDNSSYSLTISFTVNINQGDKILVTFTKPIVSEFNSILATQSLEIELFAESTNDEASAINQAKDLAQTAVYAGIAAVFGSSFINLNPITFFNFLNNLDIYVYTTLYYANLDSALVAFLQTLSPNSWVPNTFSYFINANDGSQLDSAFNNFGNSTNLIMINSGSTLGVLVVMITIPLIALLFKKVKIEWFQKKLKQLFNSYRFRAFLRFFLQSFLELSCNSAIGISYTLFANTTQIIDFVLCLLIAVFFM